MAWTIVASRGAAFVKTAGSTLAFSPTGTLTAGNIAILTFGWDAEVAGTTVTTHYTVTDTAGNPWSIPLAYQLRTGSLAGMAAGLAITKLTASITTSDTITITNTVTAIPVAKTYTLREFSLAAGKTWEVSGTGQNSGSTTTAVSVAATVPDTTTRLWFAIGLSETAVTTGTLDADYTNTSVGTTGGTDASNVRQRSGYRIAGISTDTYTVQTGATSTRHVAILVVIEEIDEGAPPEGRISPAVMQIRQQGAVRA